VLAASNIALMMEAASTSETVNFYQSTWCNITENSHLLSQIMFKLHAVSDDNENNGDQTEIVVAKQSITTLLKIRLCHFAPDF
jgi:ABC-type proline/glycine betaine transport system substrate-binding protein